MTSSTSTTKGHVPARALAFAALCLVCVLLGGGYILRAVRRSTLPPVPVPAAPAAGVPVGAPGVPAAPGVAAPAPAPLTLDALVAVPHALVRSTAQDASFGRLALAPLDQPDGGRFYSDMACERVYFAAGRGICLQADRGVFTTYKAQLFDAQLRPGKSFPLAGIPSRARISPDGRYAATTVFVTGHSYSDGTFSTHTTVVDTTTGEEVADLEQFTVMRDGAQMQSPDFNFWGVTFARDANHIYATLGTGGKTFLVEGDLAKREVRVLREGVECPSLSPDNTRVAFKKLVGAGSRPVWRVAILDLATLNETVLPLETHSVDDQIEWQDDQHVVYGLPAETATPSAATNVYSLAVDGATPPQLLMKNAWSPAVAKS